jgi:hypothetical protein
MQRRRMLALAGGLGTASLAGCAGLFQTESRSVGVPDPVENPPGGVYVPSHVEGMQMIGQQRPGRYRIALTYSFPHRFWLVTGDRTNLVEAERDESVHLMASVLDSETNTVVPSSNAHVSITRDGSTVVDKDMWPMLSQNMGFHFGDNVTLDGSGTYEVTVDFGPVGTRATGGFRDGFGRVSPTFAWEFDTATRDEIEITRLPDRKGQRGAVAPMQMDMLPVPQLPAAEDLPGRPVGTGRSGDAKFATTVLDSPPAGVEGEGAYLVVSARTPYNRFPIPGLSLSATVERGGETVFDGRLPPTLDPDLRYHYGAVVDSLESGDAITVSPGAPPQFARHEGYETAFLDVSSVELTV